MTVVCKTLPKKRLNEGLQFIVDLPALKQHPDATGKGTNIPSTGLPVHWCHQFVLWQMYTEHLLCAGHCCRPWEYSCEQGSQSTSQRQFAEMEILLWSFGTSWIGLLSMPQRMLTGLFIPWFLCFEFLISGSSFDALKYLFRDYFPGKALWIAYFLSPCISDTVSFV